MNRWLFDRVIGAIVLIAVIAGVVLALRATGVY